MNEIMLKAKFNDCFLSLNPENQFSRPLSALPRQNHPVREEPGDGESIGLSSLHHAMESHARETFDLGDPPGMIVAVEPGDDVTMPAQGREDLGRIPGIVPSRGRHGMIRADDDLESALRGVSRDAFEPGELLRPDSSVPILRLRQPASLRTRVRRWPHVAPRCRRASRTCSRRRCRGRRSGSRAGRNNGGARRPRDGRRPAFSPRPARRNRDCRGRAPSGGARIAS